MYNPKIKGHMFSTNTLEFMLSDDKYHTISQFHTVSKFKCIKMSSYKTSIEILSNVFKLFGFVFILSETKF